PCPSRSTLYPLASAPFELDCQRQAAADCVAVNNDRTRPALAVLAADMRAGQPQFVAQTIGEAHPRLDLDLGRPAIDLERDRHHRLPSCVAARNARSTSVARRARRYSESACRSCGGLTAAASA